MLEKIIELLLLSCQFYQNWLNNLVTNIQHTLKRQMIECLSSYPVDGFNEKLLQQYVMQVLSTTRAIEFTKQTEKSIQSMSLQKLQKQLNAEISKYVEWKRESKDNLLQIKLRCILFDLAHYVTVVEQLIQEQVVQLNDWHWLAQLRFYMSDESVSSNGRVLVRMVYAEFEYSYEYLGNPNKLVSTRLTHKCYLILTQAMNMGLGGNPFGPAGTGKTECVKALGALLGRLVLVFNCDEVCGQVCLKVPAFARRYKHVFNFMQILYICYKNIFTHKNHFFLGIRT